MKRNHLLLMLLVTAALVLFAFGASAEIIDSGDCGDNESYLPWELDSNGTLTISGSGQMYNYYDEEYGDLERPWEDYSDEIKSVVIEYGVRDIGINAFQHFVNLTDVSIPSSVTKIRSWAFYDCSSLSYIEIPASVKMIGHSTFEGCDALSEVYYRGPKSDWYEIEINDGNDVLDYAAYYFETIEVEPEPEPEPPGDPCGKDGDEVYYTLEDGTLTVFGYGEMADYSAERDRPWNGSTSSIKKVVVEYGVTGVGRHAFSNCKSISSLTLSETVTHIGYKAFYSCNALGALQLPTGLTNVDKLAFAGCDGVTSVTIPESLTDIGANAFSYCNVLSSITVSPDNPNYSSDSIGCFYNKDKTVLRQYPIGRDRTSYTLPESVTAIDDYAFANCMNLTALVVPKNSDFFASDDNGCLYNKDYTTLIQYPIGNTRDTFVLPDTVTHIENDAFYGVDRMGYLKTICIADAEDAWKAMWDSDTRNDELDGMEYIYNYTEPEPEPVEAPTELIEEIVPTEPAQPDDAPAYSGVLLRVLPAAAGVLAVLGLALFVRGQTTLRRLRREQTPVKEPDRA